MGSPAELLVSWLGRQAPAAAQAWLRGALDRAAAGDEGRLVQNFSLAPRRLGRAPLALNPGDRETARLARPGWRPWTWSIDEGARACLLLAFAPEPAEAYRRAVERLFELADGREHIALLRALPLLPQGAAFVERAAAGVRSNSEAVLTAIAFDNPYPAEHFSPAQWNRMVLKCLFLDLPLTRVAGLAARWNDELARMAADLVLERRAAGRRPPPDAGRLAHPAAPLP